MTTHAARRGIHAVIPTAPPDVADPGGRDHRVASGDGDRRVAPGAGGRAVVVPVALVEAAAGTLRHLAERAGDPATAELAGVLARLLDAAAAEPR